MCRTSYIYVNFCPKSENPLEAGFRVVKKWWGGPSMMEAMTMPGWTLEDDLGLEAVLHVVELLVHTANGLLVMDIPHIALDLQVMLVEVVGDGADRFGYEVVVRIPVLVQIRVAECNLQRLGNDHVTGLGIVALGALILVAVPSFGLAEEIFTLERKTHPFEGKVPAISKYFDLVPGIAEGG